MKNPFQYAGIVGEESFCNRKKELADLHRAMENADKLFVYSERRLGKTSLVLLAFSKLPKKHFLPIYIDLWPTDGEATFVTTMAKAITKAASTTIDKMIETAKTFFSHLTPRITVDDEGKPVAEFGISRSTRMEPELDEVLSAPAILAKRRRQKVVVVFDEFQRIVEYENDHVERRLRSIIQMHKAISYIFLGSRKHVIQKMFLDKSRPLYRAAAHYPLHAIEEKDWMPFIRKRFFDDHKHIADRQIHDLCSITGGHPFYTQHLCHTLWELCERGGTVTNGLLKKALDVLLSREEYAYITLWESLTKNQQRFLRALASEDLTVKPFASEFIQRHHLGSASSAQRVLDSLLEKDIIDRENASLIILDRFFRLWLRSRS